jgi:hypothetical protein
MLIFFGVQLLYSQARLYFKLVHNNIHTSYAYCAQARQQGDMQQYTYSSVEMQIQVECAAVDRSNETD